MTEGDEIATVSDEALTLLGFENNIEIWDDIWKVSSWEIRRVRQDETIPDHFKSKLLPIYTRTCRSNTANQRNTEDKRWNTQGITRFNQLRLLVIQNCEDYPDFKITWLKQVREEMKGTVDNDFEDLEESGNIDADDNLFSGKAAAHPVLNPARQNLGAHSDTDDSSEDN
jgi:hypothetical protein